jgi:hypothetical protein
MDKSAALAVLTFRHGAFVPKPVPRYRFGPIDVDASAGEIYKAGVKLRVPRNRSRSYSLLEQPGEVGRDSQQLWVTIPSWNSSRR